MSAPSGSRFFLIRLLRESKIFFAFAVLFILAYSVFFYKKMDFVLFPQNSMFSADIKKNDTSSAFILKINSRPVLISHDLYLKKDFSEMSLYNFSLWIKSGGQSFIKNFIDTKFADEGRRNKMTGKLTPDPSAVHSWPKWFARFHGIEAKKGDTAEIWEIIADMKNGGAKTDSILILKETIL